MAVNLSALHALITAARAEGAGGGDAGHTLQPGPGFAAATGDAHLWIQRHPFAVQHGQIPHWVRQALFGGAGGGGHTNPLDGRTFGQATPLGSDHLSILPPGFVGHHHGVPGGAPIGAPGGSPHGFGPDGPVSPGVGPIGGGGPINAGGGPVPGPGAIPPAANGLPAPGGPYPGIGAAPAPPAGAHQGVGYPGINPAVAAARSALFGYA